jgi:hypothetical protein
LRRLAAGVLAPVKVCPSAVFADLPSSVTAWLKVAEDGVEESEFFERKRLGVWLSDW